MRYLFIIIQMLIMLYTSSAAAVSRIKDVVDVEGVRDNILIGYGLVVGLNNTGDDIKSMAFTEQSLVGMLERLGVNTRDRDIKSKNVAAVMVTGILPPFARQGSRIDVTVSALGDCDSLLGGTLLITPLVGADGEVYAIAQGNVAIGGFKASGQGATVTKGVPTSGRIVNGALVEREVEFDFSSMKNIRFALKNADFTTAARISDAINAYLGTRSAKAVDPATVEVAIPPLFKSDIVGLVTSLEQLKIMPDDKAKIVIDEASGTIVIGQNVRISSVAIAQGGLTIRVTETPQVSQPLPFSETGETTVVPRTDIQVDEEKDNKLHVLKPSVTLQELVDGLNALGIGPRDLITILQAIKASGALQADIEIL